MMSKGCIITSSGRYLDSITFLRRWLDPYSRDFSCRAITPIPVVRIFWGNPTKITIQTPWHQSTSIQTPDLLTGQQKSAKFQKFPPQKEKSGRKKSTTNNINIMKHLSQGFPYFVLSLGHGYSLTQSKNQRTNSRENQETWCMGWEFTPCMATPGFPWWATDVELRSCDKSRGPDIYS